MKSYEKILKVLMWVLIIISVALVAWGFAKDFPESYVDTLMSWTYLMIGIILFAVIVIGAVVSGINNPKSLLKLLGILVGIGAVVGVVYAISSGAPAIGLSVEQPTASTLKLTDTVLNLTYLFAAGAVLAIIFGEIVGAIRNK